MIARVEGDLSEVHRAIAETGNILPRLHVQTINQALNKARGWTARSLAERTGLKASALRRRLKVKRVRRGDLDGHLGALWGNDALLSHSRRKPRQTRTGVTAGQYTRKGAFIQRVRNRKDVVLKRSGPGRYPLDTEKVALLPDADRIATVTVRRRARSFWVKEFERRARLELRNRGFI